MSTRTVLETFVTWSIMAQFVGEAAVEVAKRHYAGRVMMYSIFMTLFAAMFMSAGMLAMAFARLLVVP